MIYCCPHTKCLKELSVYNEYTGFRRGNRREEITWKNRRRCEYNIKMDLQEMGCGGMDWIELAQERDSWWACVNVIMNLWFP
jgi:hypothetical protein